MLVGYPRQYNSTLLCTGLAYNTITDSILQSLICFVALKRVWYNVDWITRKTLIYIGRTQWISISCISEHSMAFLLRCSPGGSACSLEGTFPRSLGLGWWNKKWEINQLGWWNKKWGINHKEISQSRVIFPTSETERCWGCLNWLHLHPGSSCCWGLTALLKDRTADISTLPAQGF